MMIDRAAIDQSAKTLLAFLERNRRERTFRFPFHGSFPTNACESTSLILTYLLEEKYGLGDVMIIKGSKTSGYDNHFWVVTGGLTYDLTAHQFEGGEPIIGALAAPLHHTFGDWTVEPARDFVEREAVIARYKAGVIPF